MNLEGNAAAPGHTADPSGGIPARGRDSGAAPIRTSCEVLKLNRCYATVAKPGAPAPAAAGSASPALTFRDLAAFRAAPGRQQMEPNGWVVPGLDANFYAVVDQQLVPGALLGQTATVRFTPVRYHWSYGDGATAVRSTKGGSWAELGLSDFDPTPTSHVYEREGDYVIRLTIDFRADYRFGSGGFVPVAGTISLPANDLHVTVTGAKTVLVEHDCVAAPSGPGC
ncbi:MAG: hypothetical protein HIU88_13720 [Acidobacteria bacterium]|nr:hypothetical protein [Acidobacteriota bacterium]